MGMSVIVPITISGSVGAGNQLIAINATETAYPLWVTATAYTANTSFVRYNNRKYQCLVSHTSGPTTLPDAINGTTWLDLGPTNQWAMFDNETSTATTNTGSIIATIKPKTAANPVYWNSIAVMGVTGAASVKIDIYNGTGRTSGDLIYTMTTLVDNTPITNWYEYYFAAFQTSTEFIFNNLPSYLNAEIVLTITGQTIGTLVSCGGFVVGLAQDLGGVQYGASAGILDYSVKETDAFGVTTFVQRNFAKRVDYQLKIPNSEIRRVYSALTSLRATPAVWIGSEEYKYSPLVVFGFYKDFSITVQYPNHSNATLEIEGLT